MFVRIVDPEPLTLGSGSHPAASPFDKRVNEALGVRAFEVYKVELPPHGETVRHDHLYHGVEDMYFIVSGEGWVIVDDEQLPVKPGLFVAVTIESARQVRAGMQEPRLRSALRRTVTKRASSAAGVHLVSDVPRQTESSSLVGRGSLRPGRSQAVIISATHHLGCTFHWATNQGSAHPQEVRT